MLKAIVRIFLAVIFLGSLALIFYAWAGEAGPLNTSEVKNPQGTPAPTSTTTTTLTTTPTTASAAPPETVIYDVDLQGPTSGCVTGTATAEKTKHGKKTKDYSDCWADTLAPSSLGSLLGMAAGYVQNLVQQTGNFTAVGNELNTFLKTNADDLKFTTTGTPDTSLTPIYTDMDENGKPLKKPKVVYIDTGFFDFTRSNGIYRKEEKDRKATKTKVFAYHWDSTTSKNYGADSITFLASYVDSNGVPQEKNITLHVRVRGTYYSAEDTLIVSPLVLDITGQGKVEASNGKWLPHPGESSNRLAVFDLLGSGFPLIMEWVGPHDGLLVVPKEDGTVDGTSLFGNAGGFASGYEKLSLRDENHDGKITGDELKGLYVWQNLKGDGKVHPGELKSVQELGITEIGVNPDQNMVSYFVMNGKKQVVWDWYPNATEVLKLNSPRYTFTAESPVHP